MATQRGTALVTGASTGIGRATAIELARRGFDVFGSVRRKADGEALADASDGGVTPITLDITKPRTISAARAKLAKATGSEGLAALVNNAGVAVAGPLETLPLADFRDQIEVNMTGHLAVTQAMLPMLRAARGRIVNITSIGGLVAYPFSGPYHASKWGLEALSDALRAELAPWDIDVIVIEPGSIATDIWDRGINRADAARKKLGKETEELYGDAMDAMTRTMRETGESGIPAEKPARVIAKALTARRPKTRYIVGADAKVAIKGKRLLSDRAFDKLVVKRTGIPGRGSATGPNGT
jgi:NAD(P)-dependent dehydrogenase (short-subunit alcohol dehydrogenase family)